MFVLRSVLQQIKFLEEDVLSALKSWPLIVEDFVVPDPNAPSS
jgi:hypothetical protein